MPKSGSRLTKGITAREQQAIVKYQTEDYSDLTASDMRYLDSAIDKSELDDYKWLYHVPTLDRSYKSGKPSGKYISAFDNPLAAKYYNDLYNDGKGRIVVIKAKPGNKVLRTEAAPQFEGKLTKYEYILPKSTAFYKFNKGWKLIDRERVNIVEVDIKSQ